MVQLKRFVGLFIGQKREGEIKVGVGARIECHFVHFEHCRNDLILLVKVHKPLPLFTPLSLSDFHSLSPLLLLRPVKEKRICLCESVLLKKKKDHHNLCGDRFTLIRD